MLENASFKSLIKKKKWTSGACGGANTPIAPPFPMGLKLKYKTNFVKQIKSILQAIPCLYNN